MIDLLIWSLLVQAVASFVLGGFVLWNNIRKSLNFSWALTCFSVGLWAGGLFFILISRSPEAASFWVLVNYFGAAFIPSCFLFFIFSFFRQERRYRLILGGVFLISLVFFVSQAFAGLISAQLSFKFYGRLYTDKGILFDLFVFEYFFVAVIAHLYALLNMHILTIPLRRQINIILVGSFIGFCGGATTVFPVYHIQIVPFGIPLVFLYIVLVTALILKQELMDIRLIVNRSAARVLTNFILISIFIVFLYSYHEFYHLTIDWVLVGFVILFGIIVGETYHLLREKIQTGAVDKWISDTYQPEPIFDAISTTIFLSLETQDVLNAVAKALKNGMKLSRAFFGIYQATSEQNPTAKLDMLALDWDRFVINFSAFSSFFHSMDEPVLLSELPDNFGQTLQSFFPHKQVLFCPIHSSSEFVGMIILDQKVSEAEFGLKDIQFVKRVMTLLKAVLDRNRPYEEIKQQFIENQQKLYDAELRIVQAKKEEAELANQYKSQFLAQMTHDLRTPLHVVIGSLDLLARRPEIIADTDMEKTVSIALKSAEHQLKLVNTILDLSKIERGKIELITAPFPLSDLTDDLTDQAETLIKDLPISFEIHNDAPEDAQLIVADRIYLIQVLSNLLSNAVKFTEKGTISLTISKRLTDGQSRLYFALSDTGIGISPDNLSRLFSSYTQIDNAMQKKYRGTGLGLSICKGLVRAHHGEIYAKSLPTQGSTFEFWIPFIAPTEVERDLFLQSGTTKGFDRTYLLSLFQHKRLLMVDDNSLNRYFFTLLLNNQVSCDVVSSGKEAVEMASAHHYDLILLDLHMPNMDGWDTFRAIRAFDETTPIAAITAEAMTGTQEELEAFGFSGYLPKPFKEADLLVFIARVLEISISEKSS